MALFNLFKRREATPQQPKSADTTVAKPTPADEASAKVVFQRPDLLADWVEKHFLDGVPIERDYGLLPNADARQSLEITPEQRDRCLGEYSVLRAAGVSLFVSQNYDDNFWLIFNDRLVQSLNKRLDEIQSKFNHAQTRRAVEDYVTAGRNAAPEEIATIYMRRIYDDNPNFIRMKVSGIGNIANDNLLSNYDIFRDAYCQVMHGLSYETLKALSAAAAKDSEASQKV
ncbi:MAG: hypothetical protein JF606_22135 [Burkholderiales bacterium]|nr:hypothetical protein [Burkholderiales bacterium]